MSLRIIALAILVPITLQAGCFKAGKPAFLQVQMCLENKQGVILFKDLMQDIAQEEGMDYLDRSDKTQREWDTLNIAPDYSILHIGATGDEGFGFHAANMGLSEYEVMIAFSDGFDSAGARQFADRTVARLRQQWVVHTVPSERGALPMVGCPSSRKLPGEADTSKAGFPEAR